MKIRSAVLVLITTMSCFGQATISSFGQTDWKAAIKSTVPLYGHRNWIAVADSAYPEQSAPGIETVVADAGQVEVVNFVLDTLEHSRHVRPTVYTDQELEFLNDEEAPGISGYRDQLKGLLGDRSVQSLPHEQIIGRLDQASRSFRVLIIKTKMALPYTSVFLQLDCAYWPSEAEQRLRQRMKAAKH